MKDIDSRIEALNLEKEKIKSYKKQNNDTPPDGNKDDKDDK